MHLTDSNAVDLPAPRPPMMQFRLQTKMNDLPVEKAAVQLHSENIRNRFRNFIFDSHTRIRVLQRDAQPGERRRIHLEPRHSALTDRVLSERCQRVGIGKENASQILLRAQL